MSQVQDSTVYSDRRQHFQMSRDPEKHLSEPPVCRNEGSSSETHQSRVERLFREYNQSLLRFLRSRVGSQHEAREIAQEAYVRLLKLDNPGAVSFLQAYLFKTAANIATERFSQRQTRDRCDHLIFFEDEQALAEPPPDRQCAAQQDSRCSGVPSTSFHRRSALLSSSTALMS